MDKKELLAFNQIRSDMRRLEKVVTVLLRRVHALEKQTRSIKAKAHQAGAEVSNLTALQRGGSYDPPGRGF